MCECVCRVAPVGRGMCVACVFVCAQRVPVGWAAHTRVQGCTRVCPSVCVCLSPCARDSSNPGPGLPRIPVPPVLPGWVPMSGFGTLPSIRPLLPLFGHFAPSNQRGGAGPEPAPAPPEPAPVPAPLPSPCSGTGSDPRHEQLPVQQGPVLRPLRRSQEPGEPRRGPGGIGTTGRG